MVFGVQYLMTADMAVIVAIYIYILYKGVTVHYVVFLGLTQTHKLTRPVSILATPLE
jgi:hypothetical protein